METRVFVVDDQPLLSGAITALLNVQPDVTFVGSASDVRTARSAVERSTPDVVLLEISFRAGPSGLELIKDLKATHPGIRTLVFSNQDEHIYAERAIRAGASGYLTKWETAETLLTAIRKVVTGQVYMSPALTEVIVGRFLNVPGATQGGPEQRLTDRELEVFTLIGRGKANKAIAKELRLDTKTIETYRGRIKRKLGLHNGVELHQSAMQFIQNRGSAPAS